MIEHLEVGWLPDVGNTVEATHASVQRSVDSGPWIEIGQVPGGAGQVEDTSAPHGVVSWKAVMMAGTVVGPESSSVTRTIAQFTGTVILIVAP